jgi:NADPH:quinone reductase-like Zn-dependent oxidoreductase
MKAVVCKSYGPPSVLQIEENYPIPKTKDNEILVKVHMATVNRTDEGIRSGLPYIIRLFEGLFKPHNEVPGTEFTGEITSIGKKVQQFQIGDRVLGFDLTGAASLAEYLVIAEDGNVAKIPEGITYKQATAGLEGFFYSFNVIKMNGIKKGDRVLVNGSTGSIGTSCVQILKQMECDVTAVCNTKNISLVKSLGANQIFDYQNENFREIKHEELYDYIMDNVIDSSFGSCSHLLKEGGTYIASDLGPWGFQNPLLHLSTSVFGSKRVKLVIVQEKSQETLKEFAKFLEEGKWNSVIDSTFKMEDVAKAAERVESGEKTGSVLISIIEEETEKEDSENKVEITLE